MSLLRALLPVFLLCVVAFTPSTTFAATSDFFGPIIPTGCYCDAANNNGVESAPEWGCVLQVVQNTVNVAISIGVIIVVFVIAYAGALWMFSSFNAHNREVARQVLLNAVIGLVIALSAWLLVDFVMKTLYNPTSEGSGVKFGPWNKILGAGGRTCIEVKQTGAIGAPTVGGGDGVTTGTGSQTANCPTCVSLAEKGLSCKSASSCSATPATANKLVALKGKFSGAWIITEAFPPTATHKASCHYNGTCVDAAFRGSTTYTVENVKAFVKAAQNAGVRAVFETDNCDLRDSVRAAGVNEAWCKADDDFKHITGSHFSLY